MKKVLSILLTAALVFSLSLSALALETTDPKAAIETGIALDAGKDKSVAAQEANDDKVSKKDLLSFKGQLKDKIAELNVYRAEAKALWTKIQSLNQSIKAEWTSVKSVLAGKEKKDLKEAKKIVKELQKKLETLRSTVKAAHNSIKTLRAEKKVQWEHFRAAREAKNFNSASAAMDNIIRIKKEIIEQQKVLVDAKEQILAALKAR